VLNKKSSVYPCKAYKNRVTDGEGNCQGLAEMRRSLIMLNKKSSV
jgi:hypothetical protein